MYIGVQGGYRPDGKTTETCGRTCSPEKINILRFYLIILIWFNSLFLFSAEQLNVDVHLFNHIFVNRKVPVEKNVKNWILRFN